MWATLPVRAAGIYAAETHLRRAYGAKMERVSESVAMRWRAITALTSTFRKQ